MDYATFKATVAELERAERAAAARLRAIPGTGSGPMGLTPDAVKFSPEWQAARAAHAAAFARLQDFNRAHVKRFRKEASAERAARLVKA